jgi:hypothetical protein
MSGPSTLRLWPRVIVSRAFLKFAYPRKELDGLAGRSRVVTLLSDATEAEVGRHSPRLAVAASPGAMAGGLVKLLKAEG